MLSLSKLAFLMVLYTPMEVGSRAQTEVETAPTHPYVASSPTIPAKSLPEQFASVLAEVKAKSRIPVLLPSQLSQPIKQAKHAIVAAASDDKYAIDLYYELGVGDSGFAALFAAQRDPDFDPHDLGYSRKVKLAHGLFGYFRPVSCGGSCAPANIWWKDNRVLYQIQLKLPSSLREREQQKVTTAAADSAILAAPR